MPSPESPPEADTAPATCPIWCVREHSPHHPPVHASEVTSIAEAVQERVTEVSLLQFPDEPAKIRLHTYGRRHQCGKQVGGCQPSHLGLAEAEESAEVWERGGSPEVAAAIRTAVTSARQGMAVSA